MNSGQYIALWQALLAAGGPLAALLVQYGIPEARVDAWMRLASAVLAILTPVIAGFWAARSRSDQNTLKAAANNDPAISVVVPEGAKETSKAVANDATVPNVTTPAGGGK